MPNSEKPRKMSKFFVNELNQMYGYKGIYIDWKDNNLTTQRNGNDILNLKPTKFYNKVVSNIKPIIKDRYSYSLKDIDIFRKSYFGLRYFYYETKYRWVHRGTDDNVINLRLLNSFYSMIEEKYDPLSQPIILGNCIQNYNTLGFLQGGSGYLYSRKSIELILPIYERIIQNCILNEDICHNEFLNYLNISIVNATSTYFLGHPFDQNDLKRLMNEDFKDLKTCSTPKISKNSTICKEFHAPLNKVVFLHHHGKNIEDIINKCKTIFNLKDERIHFYIPDAKFPRLCKYK